MMKEGDRIRRISGALPWCELGYETVAKPGTTEETVWYRAADGTTMNSPADWWVTLTSRDFPDVNNSTPATPAELLQELHVQQTTPLRVQILNEGARITNGDRDAEYGPPAVNMAASGALKATFREYMVRDISPAELEAIDMALTKLGRIATGPKPKQDTYVDAATYLAIAGEIALTAPKAPDLDAMNNDPRN